MRGKRIPYIYLAALLSVVLCACRGNTVATPSKQQAYEQQVHAYDTVSIAPNDPMLKEVVHVQLHPVAARCRRVGGSLVTDLSTTEPVMTIRRKVGDKPVTAEDVGRILEHLTGSSEFPIQAESQGEHISQH